MIIRSVERPSALLLTRPMRSPDKLSGTVGQVETCQLTSAELRETFGISLGETKCESPFELVAALTRHEGRSTAARIRKDRLVRLLSRRDDLLPCLVGYQEVPGLGLLPFMTDGVAGRWSLFFEQDGRMTLAEKRPYGIELVAEGDLLETVSAEPRSIETARSFRFGGGASGTVVSLRPQASA